MELTGRHLILRDIRPNDYPVLHRIELDDPHWRFRGSTPGPEAYARSLYEGVLVTCAVLLRAVPATAPIGIATAYGADLRNGHCYASIIVESRYCHTGLGLEAIAILIDHVFESFPMRKIYFETTDQHAVTWGSAVGSHLHQEARFRDHEYVAGVFRDRVVHALGREQWPHLRDRYLATPDAPPATGTRDIDIDRELTEATGTDVTNLADNTALQAAGIDSLGLFGCLVRIEELAGCTLSEQLLATLETLGDLRHLWRTRLAHTDHSSRH